MRQCSLAELSNDLYYIYNTKNLQACQDVEENNVTEVGDDRKTRNLFS
ncbi:hypothetical protein H6F71_08810 [Microcoleus sp. FACHB-61]|nr:hypothetical protein [Microcoleus sp. FACHB-61]